MAAQPAAARRRRGAKRQARPEAAPARGPRGRAGAVWRSFSGLGVVIGALFFAASLTPSLIPRSFLLQGVLAGACFAVGYGVGAALLWLWDYLRAAGRAPRPAAQRHLGGGRPRRWSWSSPSPGARRSGRTRSAPASRCRRCTPAHPLEVMAIAAAVALVLILLGRLFLWVARVVRRRLARHVPERISRVRRPRSSRSRCSGASSTACCCAPSSTPPTSSSPPATRCSSPSTRRRPTRSAPAAPRR